MFKKASNCLRPLGLTLIIVSMLPGLAAAQDMAAPPNSLVVNNNGFVGVGTDAPAVRLEVRDTTAPANKRFMLKLNNNGAPGVQFSDSSTGDSWQFSSLTSGEFTISFLGSGGSEMIVRKTGELQVGPGGASRFRVDPTGNGFFVGQVTANGVVLDSDRSKKQNFRDIDAKEVLAKVNALDITRWNFKQHDPEVDHIGPMSQDFYEAFGTGKDNKHISPMDMASVALAAVKGLQLELEDRDSKLAQQDETIAELKRSQARMESMLQALMINTEAQSLPAVYAPGNTGL